MFCPLFLVFLSLSLSLFSFLFSFLLGSGISLGFVGWDGARQGI